MPSTTHRGGDSDGLAGRPYSSRWFVDINITVPTFLSYKKEEVLVDGYRLASGGVVHRGIFVQYIIAGKRHKIMGSSQTGKRMAGGVQAM